MLKDNSELDKINVVRQRRNSLNVFDVYTNLPLYAVFILVLIITSAYFEHLFPCHFQRLLKNNIYVKHFFGFLTLLFFVVLLLPTENKSLYHIFQISIPLYVWFIIFTRTSLYFFVTILVLLAVTYLVYLHIMDIKEINNSEIDTYRKSLLNDEINMCEKINRMFYILVTVLTVMGWLLYMGEKKYQFRKSFSYWTFLFGDTKCPANSSSEIPFLTSLKYIFADASKL